MGGPSGFKAGLSGFMSEQNESEFARRLPTRKLG
jgi:hypothetical protein